MMFLYLRGCASDVNRSTAIATVTNTLTLHSAITMQYGTMHNVETPFSGKPDNSSCIPKGMNTPTCVQVISDLDMYEWWIRDEKRLDLETLDKQQTFGFTALRYNIAVYTRISKRVIWIYGRGVSRKEVQSYIDIAIIKQIDSNCMLGKCALLWVINRL